MRTLKSLLFIAAVLVLGTIAYAYSGLYDVSATSPHNGFVNWFLSTASQASIRRRAELIDVPDLDDESMVLAGINDFNSMCAGCHGAPGRAPEAMGLGLNPPAPDLSEKAADMSPAEMFWVTRNGIRMTGMPAWGASHDDHSIWPVVAFLTRLPGMSADAFQEMLASAAGHGHHAADESGRDHDQEGGEANSASNVHVHADGSEHVHEDDAGVQAGEIEVGPELDNKEHEHNDD